MAFSNWLMAPRTWRTRTAVGVSVVKKSGARRRHQLDAELLEIVVAGELHREVAGEPVRALYEDGTHAIAGNAGKHGLEASDAP